MPRPFPSPAARAGVRHAGLVACIAVGLCCGLAGCDDGQPTAAVTVDAVVDRDGSGEIDRGVEPDALAPDAGPTSLDPRFDPAADDFYATPWPSDARTVDGRPSLDGFLVDRAALQRVIEEIETRIDGFATMPIAYFAFDGPLGELALPTPAESVAADAAIQLIVLGAECGRRVPVEAAVRLQADKHVPADVLQIKNTVGTVLEPGVPHAVVITRRLANADGLTAAPPRAFLDAWAGDGTRWAASLEPLRDCLPDAGLDAEQLAVATVFTPQDPVAEVQSMRDRVMDAEQVETRAPVILDRDVAWSRRRLALTTLSGLVEMPVFQDGITPYVGVGGGFVLDPDGVPEIQRWEEVPFAVAWRDLPDFEGPRPALVFIDGTGWSPWSHLRSRFIGETLDAGFVIFSFMPQFHGERAGVLGGPELATFNFINPTAGRTNFSQQAVENAFFSRIVREQLADRPDLPAVDVERIVYGGHSQGALAGALTAAIDDSFAAFMFNGLSSYLTLTILFRDDLLDFEVAVRGLLGVEQELDLFHPALHLMQLGSEVVDPHNFARLWRGSAARPEGNHVFVINGFTDDTTTPRGMDHLTLSAGLPVFDAPGWDIDPFGVGLPPLLQPPVAGNAESLSGRALTVATYLDPHQGHFTVYRNSILRRMAITYWQAAVAGEVPPLVPVRELMCGDGGDGDGDGLVDCDDDDCVGREPCLEVVCDDERDGDGDALVDCDDPDCIDDANCQEEDCGDGLDDDGDGLTDCDDPGCARREPCGEGICDDGEDGDGDGLVDCEDEQCIGLRICLEFDCRDLRDNDRNGFVDCEDPACLGARSCPEPACDDGTDEDGNGLTDCADPRCFGHEACPTPAETVCDDGADDDGDGAADCADPDCALFEACRDPEVCAAGDLGQATGIAVFQGTTEERPDAWPPGDCSPLGTGQDAPDVALRWTAPATGEWVISTAGSEGDTVLTVYPGDCDRARELACNDDRGDVRTSDLAVQIEEGTTITIVVGAYEEDTVGPLVLHIFPRPVLPEE